jgi:hypothetical protein
MQYTGLGIAMLPEWGLVAVDFDDCVIDGVVVQEVFDLVDVTYWEFSPSGHGVRAFFKGSVRDAKSLGEAAKARGWGVEFFCSKGFVTVTGNVSLSVELIGPEIIELTPEIMALYDKCFGARGSKSNSEQPVVNMTDEEIVRMLKLWDPDCDYDTWLHIGMSIHHETHGEGFELWDEWSSGGADYSREDCEYKWEGFGRDDKDIVRTIRWMLNDKPIDFVLENVGNDFEPLPVRTDAAGKEIRAIPPMKLDSNGDIAATVNNVASWMKRSDLVKVEIGRDTFRDEIMMQTVGGAPDWTALTDDDYTLFRQGLDIKKFKSVGKEMMRDCVSLIAKDNEFDSAQVWLKSLVWDGVPRVERFLEKYMGAEDSEYTRAASVYAWTAHAGRVLDPGCKADMVPVLVGPQGKGKSECVAAISPSEDFFTELDFAHRDDDASRKLRGKLVAECAELSGLGGRQMDSVKAFVTKTHERWVPKYKETPNIYPRRFLIWGTSNADDFLEDTENRRWIPIRVNGGQVVKVRRDRAQLWAEAAMLWGFIGVDVDKVRRLAAEIHAEFLRVDPWEELVSEWLSIQPSDRLIKSDCIMNDAIGLAGASRNNQTAGRLKQVMSSLNYMLKVVRTPGKAQQRAWVRRDAV